MTKQSKRATFLQLLGGVGTLAAARLQGAVCVAVASAGLLGCAADPAAGGAQDEAIETGSEGGELVVGGGNGRWYVTSSFQDAAKLTNTLATLAANNTEILDMASAANGAWVITTESTYYTGGTLPGNMPFWLSFLKSKGQTLRGVAINANGGYAVVGDSMYHTGGDVPQSAKDKLAQYFANNWQIRDIDLTNTGYVILGSGNLASYSGLDSDLTAFLADRLKSKRRVETVALGFDGRWAAVAGQEPASEGVSTMLRNRLNTSAQNQVHMSKLLIGPGSSYVLYSHGTASASPGNAIESIEYGQPGGQNLWERMNAIGVPGLSIAIIEDNQVQYARGYGVLKQGEDAHVLASTPFDMASLSKFIGALTLVKLDSDRGYDFDLDDSIIDNAVPNGIIEEWKSEGESNPQAYGFPNQDVSSALTTAHFLRHQTDFVPSGGSPSIELPGGNAKPNALALATTLNLMLGYDCTNGCGFNGSNFAWTGGGAGAVASDYDSANFLVPQAVVEDVTGVRVGELLEEWFFQPMGLTNITGRVLKPILDRAAWQHDSSGPRDKRTVYPWVFAGGIYASPSDYAEMMILALNQGRDSNGVQRVPASAISRMLEAENGNVGFGLFGDFNGDITEANDNAFRHNGSHGGRARTFMCGNPSRDGGIVITFNADIPDGPDAGTTNDTTDLRTYIVNQYMAVMGWTGNCL